MFNPKKCKFGRGLESSSSLSGRGRGLERREREKGTRLTRGRRRGTSLLLPLLVTSKFAVSSRWIFPIVDCVGLRQSSLLIIWCLVLSFNRSAVSASIWFLLVLAPPSIYSFALAAGSLGTISELFVGGARPFGPLFLGSVMNQ